jgi:hypothetical protein
LLRAAEHSRPEHRQHGECSGGGGSAPTAASMHTRPCVSSDSRHLLTSDGEAVELRLRGSKKPKGAVAPGRDLATAAAVARSGQRNSSRPSARVSQRAAGTWQAATMARMGGKRLEANRAPTQGAATAPSQQRCLCRGRAAR